jgi:hypothetical protein
MALKISNGLKRLNKFRNKNKLFFQPTTSKKMVNKSAIRE